MLTTPFFSRPELVGQTGRNWPEYEPWRVDRINGLYRDFATRYPERYTLIDLNDYVSPGGKFAEYIGDVRVRDDGVHFTPDGADLISAWLAAAAPRAARGEQHHRGTARGLRLAQAARAV